MSKRGAIGQPHAESEPVSLSVFSSASLVGSREDAADGGAGSGMTRACRFNKESPQLQTLVKHTGYRLTIEALPTPTGTPTSRLKKLLKVLSWYRFNCREVEEIPPNEVKRRESSSPARKR
jgi:hypothetical protein